MMPSQGQHGRLLHKDPRQGAQQGAIDDQGQREPCVEGQVSAKKGDVCHGAAHLLCKDKLLHA